MLLFGLASTLLHSTLMGRVIEKVSFESEKNREGRPEESRDEKQQNFLSF